MARKQNGCSAKRKGLRTKRSCLQIETKLLAALKLLFIIYRAVLVWGTALSHGVGSLGHPQPCGDSGEMQGCRAGWGHCGVTKLCGCKTAKSPLFF